MLVRSQLPELPHTSAVQGLASSQSAAVQAAQVGEGSLPQTPSTQVSVVQRSPSLQSAAVVQPTVQLGLGACRQAPSEQLSTVHASESAQSVATVQGTQPGIGSWRQPLVPPQESTVHALWSSHRLVPSSTFPSQSLSTPSHASDPTVALACSASVLVACPDA